MKKQITINYQVDACDCGCGEELQEQKKIELGNMGKRFINELHRYNYLKHAQPKQTE